MFYKRVANYLPLVYHNVIFDVEEDKMHIELSMRADKLAVDGREIPIQFIVRFTEQDGVSGKLDFSTDISLTVRDLTEANNPATNYTEERKTLDR